MMVKQHALESFITEMTERLRGEQKADGHWVFPLEADVSISAEYILLNHFLGSIDDAVEADIGVYIRRCQSNRHDGWPLFHDGDIDVNSTVKAYYALKLLGDSVDAPHMQRARRAILACGGLMACNVFTRIQLALFGVLSWRYVPMMPIEMVFLPSWLPFHLSKMSYWSRTVLMPLLIIMAKKPQAANPRGVGLAELFVSSKRRLRMNHARNWRGMLFFAGGFCHAS